MFGFLTPRYLREGRELLHAVHKILAYKRDLMEPRELEKAVELQTRLGEALRRRHRAEAEAAAEEVNRFFGERFPTPSHPNIRENTEVFLVAIVIALGIRTFFIQPFTIPTGSMQPTLNGIQVHKLETPLPNLLQRGAEWAWLGRSYFEVTPEADDTVVQMEEVTRMRFFHYTKIYGTRQSLLIPAPISGLYNAFDLRPGTPLKKNQPLRGYADTGDHVFVNKIAYNFRTPRRGEVFVFNTAGIGTEENRRNPGGPSQYYIKRLAGLPGDELRIDPPRLFVNGAVAQEPGFQRVMTGGPNSPDGTYRGYANGPLYLTGPEAPFHVPEKRYFALGDNSYNSADSRYWGTVPQDNLVGCGLFVYWPFTKHWGLIK